MFWAEWVSCSLLDLIFLEAACNFALNLFLCCLYPSVQRLPFQPSLHYCHLPVWRHGADDGGTIPRLPADWRSAWCRNVKGHLKISQNIKNHRAQFSWEAACLGSFTHTLNIILNEFRSTIHYHIPEDNKNGHHQPYLIDDDPCRTLPQCHRSCIWYPQVREPAVRGHLWGGGYDLPGHHGGAAGGSQRQDKNPTGSIPGRLHCHHQHPGRVR